MTIEPSVLIDSLSTSEGGVARIRQVLLEFAVRGALSEKDSGDPPARELLQYATKDRTAQAVAAPGRSKRRTLPRRSLEAPFALPVTWEWIAIGDAMNLVNGRAFKPSHWGSTGLPIVRIQNLNNSSAPFNYCSFEVAPKFHLKPGDFLISWSGTPGTSFGAFIWEGPPGILNQHIFRAELFGGIYNPKFLRVAINARLDEMIARAHGGVGLQHITKGELESMLIPLPPLAEQKRIVAKVDQLMALCDDLEVKQTKKRDLATQSTRSALSALSTAEEGPDLSVAWARFSANFASLVPAADSVVELRKSTLRLAVEGRLTRRKGLVPEGSRFLKLIRERGLEEATKRKIRPQDVSPIRPEDEPFSAPPGWAWARLGELCFQITDGTHYTPAYVAAGVPFLSVKDVTGGRVDFSDARYITEAEHRKLTARCRPERDDVLLTKVGTTGVARVVDTDREFSIFVSLALLKFPHDLILPDYLCLFLNSPLARAQSERDTQGVGNKNLVLRFIRDFLVPLPPLPEQVEIVDVVRKLMSLLDDLEAKLRKQEETATRLAESLAAAVAG